MHYYQFNIADYRKDTQHLSPFEHYIYRSLLDWHYLDEKPIPKDIPTILRFLRLGNDRSTDVEQVLNDFWTEVDEGYVQERVLREIDTYGQRLKTASKAGKASAKARKANKHKASKQAFNDRSTTVQPTNNQEPLTNNHKPILKDKSGGFSPPTTQEVTDYVSTRSTKIDAERFVDFYASKGWMVGKNRMKDWKAAVRNWEKRAESGNAPVVVGVFSRKETPAEKMRRDLIEMERAIG